LCFPYTTLFRSSVEYSTKYPKQINTLTFHSNEIQGWKNADLPYVTAYPTITGNIFEFGFSDSILQMWAAFCDELTNRENMKQSFYCATPEEAMKSHYLFTAALKSNKMNRT